MLSRPAPSQPQCFQGGPFFFLGLFGFNHPVYGASGLLQSLLGTCSLGGLSLLPLDGRPPADRASGLPHGHSGRGTWRVSQGDACLVDLASSGASEGQPDLHGTIAASSWHHVEPEPRHQVWAGKPVPGECASVVRMASGSLGTRLGCDLLQPQHFGLPEPLPP